MPCDPGRSTPGRPSTCVATATAERSTYAGIVRLVEEAQTSKAPFVRLADRYAILFVPLTLVIAAVAWAISGDPVRALAVLVVATPCPLLLAAPIAIVSGISRVGEAGHHRQGRRRAGGPGPGARHALRQDGHADRGPAAPRAGRHGPRAHAGRGAGAGGLARAGLAARPGGLHRGRRARARRGAASARGCRGGAGRGHLGHASTASRCSPGRPSSRAAARRCPSGPGTCGVASAWRAPRASTSRRTACSWGRSCWTTPSAPRRRGSSARCVAWACAGSSWSPATTTAWPTWWPRPSAWTACWRSARRPTRWMPSSARSARRTASSSWSATASTTLRPWPARMSAWRWAPAAPRPARRRPTSSSPSTAWTGCRRPSASPARSRRIALESVLVGMGLSVAAMLVAAAGFLQPVAGALVQEAIDVIVILNALRALTGGIERTPRIPGWGDLSARLQAEHRDLGPDIARPSLPRRCPRLAAGTGGQGAPGHGAHLPRRRPRAARGARGPRGLPDARPRGRER